MARIHQKIIGLKSQPRWVVKIFVLLGAMLGGVFAFISYPVTETKAQDYYYEEAEDEYFDDEIRDDGDYLEEGDLDVDNFDKGIEEFLTKDNLNISGDLTTFEKAFQEVAYAYYMRGPKIQYNFHKAINSWFSPEKATTQDPSYLVCSAFTKNVYYELLGIKIPIYTYDLINYTTGHIGNPEVVGYGVKTGNDFIMRIYDYDNSEAGNEYIQLTGAGLTLLNKIIPYLRIGDVLTYDGHTLVVYDLIYDETGNIINAILMESGHGAGKGFVKSKNYITQIGINYGSLNNYLYHNSKENTAFEYGLLEGTVHIKKITGETNWKNIGTDSGKTNYSILRFVQENKSGEVVIKYNTGNYNDTSFLSYLNEKTKDRLKFSKLFTEKTVSEHADDVVELGSTMEYTIVVKNNSDEDYTDDLIITENISQFVTYKGYTSSKEGIDFNKDGSILTWNIGKLRSGEEVIIEYSVDVNSGNIGDVIVSTGSVGKIPSATIKNEIGKFLNEEQGINIKSSFENLNDDYNGKELIDRIYEESLGIDLNLEDLDITNLIKNTDLTSRSYTTLSVNQSNIFSQMILNKYWSTMRLRKRNYEDTEIHIYENKTWRFLSNKDRRADTINSENFRTGDILIYTNKNDKRYIYSTGAGLSITPITYEDGEYAYIYIDGKFVGVNLGSDGLSGTLDDRNEFTRKYYIDNGISWYSHGDAISGETDEFKDALQLQTLFGKDYYVILRPSLMIRNITYELSGGTNNDENPSAFILGRDIELKEPTRTGYVFSGWYTDSEYTTQVTNTNELTDDTVLYARWELNTFAKAFQEVAYAYYMRGPYVHYNSAKGRGHDFSPEEATSQDYNYLACGLYVLNVYRELLGNIITFPPHGGQDAYAKKYVGKRPEVIGYGEKSGGNLLWWDSTTPYLGESKMINPTKNDIIKQLQIGDIFGYEGHVTMVYDYKYNESGDIEDVYLIHAIDSPQYRVYSKMNLGVTVYDKSGTGYELSIGHNKWSAIRYNNFNRTAQSEHHPDARIEGTVQLNTMSKINQKLEFNTGNYLSHYYILRFVTDDGSGNSILSINGTNLAGYRECSTCSYTYYSGQVNYSDSIQSRLKYNKLYIEKTMNKRDNTIVGVGDELTYTIRIQNNSNQAYDDDLIIKENINTDLVENLSLYSYEKNGTQIQEIQLLNDGNQLQWNIGKLNSGDEVIIQYTVKVRPGNIGETIESTGMAGGIPSGIVTNTIGRNTDKGENLKIAYNDLRNNFTGKFLINEIYREVYGINLGIDKIAEINTEDELDTGALIYYNNKWGNRGTSYDDVEMKINRKSPYSGMILNSYFNVLYKNINDAHAVNKSGDEIIITRYGFPAIASNDVDKRADTIFPGNFQTGDILIYKNSNDLYYNWETSSGYAYVSHTNTYENGEYVYIYMDGKFVGMNLGNDLTGARDDRNEFTTNYYSNAGINSRYYKDGGVGIPQNIPGGFDNWLHYQTLFGKEAYVILRPSLMIRNITYELDGGTNNDENPDAFILGREVELNDPVKDGFIFQGWYTDSELTNQVNNTNELTDDVVLYAKWENNSCTFDGNTINNGESVTGYRTNSVAYGETCESETRICTNGTLNGSYGYASCVVGEPETCVFNGSTINHGESVTGYKTNSVAYGETCESETRICENGTLNGSYGYASCVVGEPETCIFNGSTINHGESVIGYRTNSVGYGETCESETRICENGTLNGSYGYASCTVGEPASCTFNGSTINHGESVIGYRTNSVGYGETCESEIRICENGTLNGSYGYASCVVGEPETCIFNGSEINHGESVTGYRTNSVAYGETCESETRICENGTLNGSYGYASCVVGEPATCIFNGSEINHGESVTGYRTNSVGYGETCESETRICENGTLNGSYGYASCTVGEPETCIFNGSEINHGESVTGYRTNSVGYGETCESETRICINGKLSGTYGYSSCLVQSAGGVGGVSLRKDHCPNGDYSDSYYDGTCGTNTKDSSAKPQNDKMRHNSADKVVYDTLRFNPYYSDEMNRAYQFAYHYGITTKNNIKDADMDGKLTRIAMAKMLSQYAINVLGKQPDITRQNKFADVSNKLDSDYDNGVTLAYQLGIMGINMKDNKFRPYDTVSRAEFVTALSRLLYGIEDGKDKYYITHMNLLEYLGIITNTNPTMKELRGYVMIMLMRSGK